MFSSPLLEIVSGQLSVWESVCLIPAQPDHLSLNTSSDIGLTHRKSFIKKTHTLKQNIHIRTFMHVSKSGNATVNLQRFHVSLFDTLTVWIIALLNLPFLFLNLSVTPLFPHVAYALWVRVWSPDRERVWSKPVAGLATITGDHASSAISVGECGRTGEGAGRRECWEQRQTSSIPELCAHIFLSLSSRVSSADATAWRKGLLLFILSLPLLASLWSLAEGVCVCTSWNLDLRYKEKGFF